MKKYKIILTLFLGAIIVAACSEDDLDQKNPNQLDAGTFFQNPAQVQSAVNAVYANLQTRGLYARHMFFMMDNMSQENNGNTQLESDKVEYLNFSFNAGHGSIRAYWESCYRGINKANFVIGNSDLINAILPSEMTDELKQRSIGQAKFLRALYYFFLVTRFGDVPMPIDLPEGNDGYPKTSKDVVYQQIIEDLQDAIATLRDKGDEDSGRANKGAAIALLGKVYLYLEEYDQALTQFNSLSGYALEGDFSDNFLEETEHGIESIFEVQYDDDLGDSDKWASDASGHGLNEVTFRGQEYGFNDWFNVFPSDDLLNEYEVGDPRFAASFYVNGDTFGPGGSLTVAHFPSNGGGNAGWRKYQNYYKDANEDQASGINMKVIRYADVLLMMAECESLRSGGSQDAAVGYINEVRDRVGMTLLPTGMSPTAVFDAIIHERKVELAGEQVRFPDIIRWGNAATELAGSSFSAGKHEVFPIPTSEISNNVNISQADQNPGY